MKKKLIIILIALGALTAFGQEKNDSLKHITFKGVPIDGTLNNYVGSMKKSGFRLIETNEGLAILKGDFAGYKDCYIGVATLQNKDLVNKISVIFPEMENWSTLSANYYNLKEMLTEKYGDPSDVVEKFDGSFDPEDDNSRMHEVMFDNCKFVTSYEINNGSIYLTIDHESVNSCFVKLSYYDKINSQIIREKAKGDL